MNEALSAGLLGWLGEVRAIAAVSSSAQLSHSAVRTEMEVQDLVRAEAHATHTTVIAALCETLADLSEVMRERFDTLARKADGADGVEAIRGHMAMTAEAGALGCFSPAALLSRGWALLEAVESETSR
jgi:hypothetical protein